MTGKQFAIAVTMFTLTCPAWAADTAPADLRTGETQTEQTTSDIYFRSWGLRAGIADDPDQLLGGAHFNMGEFVPQLRFQPDVQLGVGDDHTTLFVTAPVYYRFKIDNRVTPYVGGGPTAGWVDHDHAGRSDSEFEIGGKLTGGLEWPGSGSRAFLVEVSFGFGDVHDAQLLAGWSF